jgi:pilus assembly protein CpaD
MVGKMRIFNTLARRLPAIGAMVLTVATVSGCGMLGSRDHIVVGSVPDDYRTRHPIVIAETQKQLMVPVGNASRELNFAEKEVVSGFIGNYSMQGSGAIYVSSPADSPNAGAAGHIANQVAQVIAENGYQGSVLMAQYNAPADQATPPVIVSFGAITASAGPCGKWTEDVLTTPENKNYSNFGCAYQNNLAAMVANPMDLLGPRKTGPIDAADRDKVISDYRTSTGTWSPNIQY